MKVTELTNPKGLGYAGQRLDRDLTHVISSLQVQRARAPAVIPGGATELRAFLAAAIAFLDANVGTSA
jgi:hypothetical protein